MAGGWTDGKMDREHGQMDGRADGQMAGGRRGRGMGEWVNRQTDQWSGG